MTSETFYLKYRPQKIADLDLKEIRQGLAEVFSSDKVPHAFLFSGPKGTGKTSSARIVARIVNCQKRKKKQFEPCNRCQACRSIIKARALDIIEIDAASNRGIDDIRNLKEKIRLTPSGLKYKVYIIDEVHMLTKEAFNALLKTLEEPPQHAIFVLCTTEPHKLPETIISRCLHFKFRRATEVEMLNALKRVVKGEGLKVKKETLILIAKGSDGSFRDGVKLLEQLSFASKTIGFKKAQELFGGGKEKDLLSFLFNRKTKKALACLNELIVNGCDFNLLGRTLLQSLRDIWLYQKGLSKGIKPLFSTPKVDAEDLKRLIVLFSQATVESKTAVIPQLPFEIAIVEWCEGGGLINQSPDSEEQGELRENEEEKPATVVKSAITEKWEKTVIAKWAEILKFLKPQNHSIEALLKAARPLTAEDDKLTIEVFYPFHKSRLETERCRSLVEEAVAKVLAKKIRVYYVLSSKPRSVIKTETRKSDKTPKDNLVQMAEEVFRV